MKQDIKKLPKWAQAHIADLEDQIAQLHQEKETLEGMHAVLANGRRWLTVPGPRFDDEFAHRTLFVLGPNTATPVCDLEAGDMLFVGRADIQF